MGPRVTLIAAATLRSDGARRLLDHGLARLIAELAPRLGRLRLCLPCQAGPPAAGEVPLDPALPIEVVPLPPLGRVVAAQRHALAARRVLRRAVRGADWTLLRLPFQIPWVLADLPGPLLIQIVGDSGAVFRHSREYRGLPRALGRGFAALQDCLHRRLVRRPDAVTVTHGAHLWRALAPRAGRALVSSCLWEREMQPARPVAPAPCPLVLFVGFFRYEKGLDLLLDAFARLRATRPCRLRLVGAPDQPGSPIARELAAAMAASPWRDDIECPGALPFGPALFDCYREADVLALPSRSEGTPRTLIEARAFGCPVVAARVGGVPSSVRHGVDGLLVPPENPAALAEALARTLDDLPLRARLIAGGAARARAAALERFVDALLAQARALPGGGRGRR